jgi:hypothetical protein
MFLITENEKYGINKSGDVKPFMLLKYNESTNVILRQVFGHPTMYYISFKRVNEQLSMLNYVVYYLTLDKTMGELHECSWKPWHCMFLPEEYMEYPTSIMFDRPKNQEFLIFENRNGRLITKIDKGGEEYTLYVSGKKNTEKGLRLILRPLSHALKRSGRIIKYV